MKIDYSHCLKVISISNKNRTSFIAIVSMNAVIRGVFDCPECTDRHKRPKVPAEHTVRGFKSADEHPLYYYLTCTNEKCKYCMKVRITEYEYHLYLFHEREEYEAVKRKLANPAKRRKKNKKGKNNNRENRALKQKLLTL